MTILENGVAIVESDTHIGAWVRECGDLIHDKWAVPKTCAHIKPGDFVLDIGANIGSHTLGYSRAVGATGKVWAFEPNPVAYECLKWNMDAFCTNVHCFKVGLSDKPAKCRIYQSQNVGASMLFELDETEGGAETSVTTLDSIFADSHEPKVNLLKADGEGWELRILRGAEQVIRKDKPIMFIEVNEGALNRQGSTEKELLDFITSLGYRIEPTDSGAQYDVFCFPLCQNENP